jgi:phage terminase large subunit
MKKISLKKIVGGGYSNYWRCQKRYVALKGGRGSKKSKTTALRWVYLLSKYDKANLLVIRKTYNTLKDSAFTDLKWAINHFGLNATWEWIEAPLTIRNKHTGQKILFRGLDDPLKLTSITVEHGHLCWAWFEEAYEITKEEDFNKIDLSIRGELPPGYFKQLVLTFNPWNEKHWLKSRFFDSDDEDILAITTNYLCNEFLGEDDIKLFNNMKVRYPKRYHVEGLGNWGISEGLVYDNWEEKEFDYMDIVQQRPGIVSRVGLDFGYVADPTGLVATIVDTEQKEIFIYDEHYQQGMRNNQIAEMIKYKGLAKEHIIADSAEPKSIDEIRLLGVYGITGAQKGRDSILNGIQFIQQFKIYVHPKCVNTILELSSYVWDKGKDGQQINKPIDYFNHILDALRYAVEDLGRQAQPRVRGL